jgi:hypothetical protein
LCYPKCEHGSTGSGPVCWGKCPAGTKECGSLCLDKEQNCANFLAEDVKAAFQLVTDAAAHATVGSVIDLAHLAEDMHYPNCGSW